MFSHIRTVFSLKNKYLPDDVAHVWLLELPQLSCHKMDVLLSSRKKISQKNTIYENILFKTNFNWNTVYILALETEKYIFQTSHFFSLTFGSSGNMRTNDRRATYFLHQTKEFFPKIIHLTQNSPELELPPIYSKPFNSIYFWFSVYFLSGSSKANEPKIQTLYIHPFNELVELFFFHVSKISKTNKQKQNYERVECIK